MKELRGGRNANGRDDDERPALRRVRWLWYGAAFLALCGVAAFAARLMWRARQSSTLSFDQWTAYAAFLLVAAAGPIVMGLLLNRLNAPLMSDPAKHSPRVPSPVVASLVISIGFATTALLVYRLGGEVVTHSVERRLQAVASQTARRCTWR
jgi:hypothetical protein